MILTITLQKLETAHETKLESIKKETNEEKVKKGKTILVQAILGLVVIWIASSVITWIVDVLGDSSST
ncbi:MAG: hypothetical protein IE909_19390 [Campylobacterales bacterium]|nr:hypothetical protein [Campylobacterales bacterium]